MSLTLTVAQSLVASILAHARQQNLKPIVAVVLDARGALKAAAAEDGTSLKRFEIAHGKAFGALSLGLGSRAIDKRAQSQPTFVAAISHIVGGSLVPVPGGVLVYDSNKVLLGAAGVSGDTSDNDEAAILAALEAAGLVGDPG